MTEEIEFEVGNPPKNNAENGPIWATPENLPFLKLKIFHFSLISIDQKYQNESSPIFCYVLRNIADLQALTPDRVKKITL